MGKILIFLSSVQKELSVERRAVKDFVQGDPLLRRFFEVFLFEDLPASDRRADQVYLSEVDRCGIYLGLFGNEYGWTDGAAKSPTELEFDRATAKSKPRLIFVKGADDKARHSRMAALIHQAGAQLIRRRFTDITDLNAALYASLVEHLERTGHLRTRPFDAAACPDATLADLAEDKVKVQVMLFADRFEVWNPGELPAALTVAQLFRAHASIPRNPLIAEPMFLAHYAEKAGSGILDMIARCRQAGLPAPQFRQEGGQFIQSLSRPKPEAAPQVTPQVTPQVDFENILLKDKALQELADALGIPTAQVTTQVTAQVGKLFNAAVAEGKSREELQSATGLADREHFRKFYIEPMVAAGLLERTIPDKPTSPAQKYRLSDKGRAWLASAKP